MTSPRRLRMGKGTTALVVACAALLLLVPIAWFLLPLTLPQTAEDAEAVVTAQVENVVATIPPALVESDEQTATDAPCPSDEGVRAVQLRRILVIDESFDVGEWPRQLREWFTPADGWHVTTHTLGGSLIISLRGPDLALVSVRVEEADAGTEMTMTSWSECTAG